MRFMIHGHSYGLPGAQMIGKICIKTGSATGGQSPGHVEPRLLPEGEMETQLIPRIIHTVVDTWMFIPRSRGKQHTSL